MGDLVPLDPIAAVFGQTGLLARAFPGYSPRDGQVAMARAVQWTGVDVPGRSCVAVIVDKLPFAPPGDPVMDAIQERAVARTGREMAGFMEESLPRAVLALRQGVGRLIRSTSDWGCVVICDPRLVTKGYGGEIVRSLGMPTRTRSVESACQWLSEGVAGMEEEKGAVSA